MLRSFFVGSVVGAIAAAMVAYMAWPDEVKTVRVKDEAPALADYGVCREENVTAYGMGDVMAVWANSAVAVNPATSLKGGKSVLIRQSQTRGGKSIREHYGPLVGVPVDAMVQMIEARAECVSLSRRYQAQVMRYNEEVASSD